MSTVAAPPSANRRSRARLILPLTEARRIRIRLLGTLNGLPSASGYVCSDPWARECVRAIESGAVTLKKQNIEARLHKAGVYPPGGAETAMVENERTLRYMPPDYTGTPLDEREDLMSVADGCRLPRSTSAVVLETIRTMKLRPSFGHYKG